jgi:DNA-binding transcriptional ArsR family regulator
MSHNTAAMVNPETGEQKILNTGFSQIYHDWWPIQRSIIDDNPTALKVFSWLIEKSDRRNAVLASYVAMAKALGVNERTVRRAVSYLAEKKLVVILKSGNTNIYVLNDRIVWKDTGDSKNKYSEFSAEIYILASEQEEPYRTQLIGHVIPRKPSASKRRKTLDNVSKSLAETETGNV